MGRGALQLPVGDVASVPDVRIAGLGGELTLRIDRGAGTQDGDRLPGLVYLYGGGRVIGNLQSHDRLCAEAWPTRRGCASWRSTAASRPSTPSPPRSTIRLPPGNGWWR